MSIFHWDYETTSACDISLGSARYACDPSTRILMFAASVDDGSPVLWDFLNPDSEESRHAVSLFNTARDLGLPAYAHNVMFEHFVSRYRLLADVGIQPFTIEQLRCTAAMARRAAIPVSLAKCAEFLKLGIDKDARGKALIGIFSDQNKQVLIRNGKESRKTHSPILENPIPWNWTMTVAGETLTVAEAWQQFKDYCRQDVRVEQRVHKALAKFEILGDELQGFQFDLRMNDLGAPVNVEALKHAAVILDYHREALEKEFSGLTGLMPTQTAKVLEWLRGEGYPGDNLQAETMEKWLGSSFLTASGARALDIRSQLSFAAVKKVGAMLDTVCPDGRMRGLFTWHGAQRTGRWTSQGPQLQNAKKPTIKDADDAYLHIRQGFDPEAFEILHGNPYEAVASCIRNFMQMPVGSMLDADFAAIELKLAGILADQHSMTDAFREGRDLYKELASVIFGIPVDEITKDQRFVGKTAFLACIYQVGAKTFHDTCAKWGKPIPKELAIKAVATFREVNYKFPPLWRKYESAAIAAIESPEKWFVASPYVKFARTLKPPFDRLIMRLPSGRDIIHPYPAVERKVKTHRDFETGEVREWETNDITFYGQMKGTAQWGRVGTYAGSLYQTSVQATARDIMVNGCLTAEREGFKIFALIHDQALAEEGDPELFVKALCTLPPWLPADTPITAEGGLAPYYRKD